MLKIVPRLDLIPNLPELERKVINNFQKYFAKKDQEERIVTLYVHPDTINANISMVLDETIYYKNREYHQLWLVNVVNENDHSYYDYVIESAKNINTFKAGLLYNKVFTTVEYPSFLNDEFKLSKSFQQSDKLTMKQRNAINTLVIGSKTYAQKYIDNDDDPDKQDEYVPENIEEINRPEAEYIKYSHGKWCDQMLEDNNFHKVMEKRKNVWTALTLEEYEVAKYFIGINLTNKNEEVNTDEILKNKELLSVINRSNPYTIVRGGAKTGKTTLLVLRALNAIRQNESITITSFTYANLSRIRLMLQKLLGGEVSLKLNGIELSTVSSLVYRESEINTSGLYIDNAEDLNLKQVNNLFQNNRFSDVFISFNPTQRVIFNNYNEEEDKNAVLNNDLIKNRFNIVTVNKMVNTCSPSIKMVYSDFLNEYTDETVDVSDMDRKGNYSVFVYDDINYQQNILNNYELEIIKHYIDKQTGINNDTNRQMNQRAVVNNNKVLVVSPKVDSLIQVYMFLNMSKLKQEKTFLTYSEILQETDKLSDKLKDSISNKDFEEIKDFLRNRAKLALKKEKKNDDTSLKSNGLVYIDDDLVRKYVNDLKNRKMKNDETDLHRFLPAMNGRVILSTLESFKGVQADNVIAIFPNDGAIIGNYGTILSSASRQLIIINKNKEFRNFLQEEKNKRKYGISHKKGIVAF